MKHNVYNLFLISYGIKPHTKRPIHTFFCDTYEKAKIYFHDYIKNSENKIGYSLYKIAEIDKNINLKEQHIFICGGYEITYKPNYQRSLIIEKELIERASREKELSKQIEILFDGKRIENVK